MWAAAAAAAAAAATAAAAGSQVAPAGAVALDSCGTRTTAPAWPLAVCPAVVGFLQLAVQQYMVSAGWDGKQTRCSAEGVCQEECVKAVYDSGEAN